MRVSRQPHCLLLPQAINIQWREVAVVAAEDNDALLACNWDRSATAYHCCPLTDALLSFATKLISLFLAAMAAGLCWAAPPGSRCGVMRYVCSHVPCAIAALTPACYPGASGTARRQPSRVSVTQGNLSTSLTARLAQY